MTNKHNYRPTEDEIKEYQVAHAAAERQFLDATPEQLLFVLKDYIGPTDGFTAKAKAELNVLLTVVKAKLEQFRGCDDAIYKMDHCRCPKCETVQQVSATCKYCRAPTDRLMWREYAMGLERAVVNLAQMIAKKEAEEEGADDDE